MRLLFFRVLPILVTSAQIIKFRFYRSIAKQVYKTQLGFNLGCQMHRFKEGLFVEGLNADVTALIPNGSSSLDHSQSGMDFFSA